MVTTVQAILEWPWPALECLSWLLKSWPLKNGMNKSKQRFLSIFSASLPLRLPLGYALLEMACNTHIHALVQWQFLIYIQ